VASASCFLAPRHGKQETVHSQGLGPLQGSTFSGTGEKERSTQLLFLQATLSVGKGSRFCLP
jgi:hypothetical protein